MAVGDADDGVQRFADLAGGPGTVQGVDYQIRVSTLQALYLLADAARDPTDPLVIAPEKRLVAANGQYGYDLGWSGGRRNSDELWEAKLTPTLEDVRHFLTTLAHRVAHADDSVTQSRIVAGHETAAVKALSRVVRLAHEAPDPEAFSALIGAAADSRVNGLLDTLGDSAWATLQVALLPAFLAPNAVQMTLDVLVSQMAMPGKAEALEAAVSDRLSEMAQTRGRISAGAFAAELQDRRILAPPPILDFTSANEAELEAVALLQRCPVPLAESVLAYALGASTDELAAKLADPLATGLVVSSDAGWLAYATALAPIMVSRISELLSRALDRLVSTANETGVASAAQTLNALALSRVLIDDRPDLAAEAFGAFDKPSKAWGDLSAVQSLAEIAAEGARRVASRAGATNETISRMAAVRARTYICGSGWVLQRVDELEEAADHMARADELSADGDNPKNRAFTLKCRGRLARLRAEDLDVRSEEREALLSESIRQLTAAFPQFQALVAEGDVGCVEDQGECLSLLARTFATRGDWEEAEHTSAQAHAILDSCPTTKAFADLLVLDAELALRRFHSGTGDEEKLRNHLHRLLELREVHRRSDQPADKDRGGSEIVARILAACARLHASCGEVGLATAALDEAAVIYGELTYPLAQCRIRWERATLLPEPLPAGLVGALDAIGADPITRVVALEELNTWREAHGGATMSDPSRAPALADTFWQGLVSRAERRARVSRPRWGEGRRLA